MKPEIYLDIDGVLNRWQLNEMSRRLTWRVTHEDWPLDEPWNIVAVHNHFVDTEHRLLAKEFWKSVPESSWVNAGRSELFELLTKYPPLIVGENNVHVITTVPPGRCPSAYSGKAIWCRENLPEWLQPQVFMTTHDKSRLARPGRLLIDDADHNIDAWSSAGGTTLQVPRPWNQTWGGGYTETEILNIVEIGLRQFKQGVCGG